MNIHTILEPIKSITAAIEHDCELIPARRDGRRNALGMGRGVVRP